MSEGIATLSDATFDEHVKSADTPVLVDFWAEWCGPCKMIAPILEEISGEQKGKIGIAKLNIDDNLDITRRYEVMSIPTMILFKDGEPRCGSWGPGARHSCSRSSRPICKGPGSESTAAAWATGRRRVADLQYRLAGVGLPCPPDPEGVSGGHGGRGGSFQYRRGLRVDGVCGGQTWGPW